MSNDNRVFIQEKGRARRDLIDNEMKWHPSEVCIMTDLRHVRSADIPAMIADAVVTYAGNNYRLAPVTYDETLDYKLLLSVIERGPTHDMSDYTLEPI